MTEQNELFNENQQAEGEEPSEVPEQEKKRVRLTVGVSPEEGREKKNPVKKKMKSGERQATKRRGYSKYHTCDETWLR